jgi:hypothetical protein
MGEGVSLGSFALEKQASEQVSEAKEDEDHYRDHRRHQPHHVEKL